MDNEESDESEDNCSDTEEEDIEKKVDESFNIEEEENDKVAKDTNTELEIE